MSTHSRRQSAPSGRDAGAGGRGRHDRHTSQACLGCRQRKIRCDPERPENGRPCSSCANAGKECVWSPVQDGRKPPTAEAHNALRRHNDHLLEENEKFRTALMQLGYNPNEIISQGEAASKQGGFDSPPPLRIPHLIRRASAPTATGAHFDTVNGGLSPEADMLSSAQASNYGGFLGVPSPVQFRRQGSNGMDDMYGSAVSDTEDVDSFDSLQAHSPHSYPSSGRSSFSFSSTLSVPPLLTVSPDSLSPAGDLAQAQIHHLTEPASAPCPCEWNRHLPMAVKAHQPPLTREEHDDLLDRYFKYSAPWNLRVIQDYFLESMRAALSTPTGNEPHLAHYSGALHNVILAEATSFHPGSWLSEPSVRLEFLNTARNSSGAGHPIAVIQTYAALSHFFMGIGKPETALDYLKETLAQAKSAGMCSSMREGLANEENRDLSWCYYTTVIQDIQIAVLQQTMPIIPQHPTNIPIVGQFGKNEGLSQLFVHGVYLGRLAGYTIQALTNGQTPTPSDISGLHAQLMTWASNLPANLQLTQKKRVDNHHILVLHIVHRWYIIHLNERFAADNADCRKHVQDAIGKIVRMLSSYRESVQSLSFSPLVLAQATFATGRASLGLCDIPLVTRKQREAALSHADFCVRALGEIAQTWQCAKEYVNTLQGELNSRNSASLRQPGNGNGILPVSAQGPQGPPPQGGMGLGSPISPPGAPSSNSNAVWPMGMVDPSVFSPALPVSEQHAMPFLPQLDTAGLGQQHALPPLSANSMDWFPTPSSSGVGEGHDFNAFGDMNDMLTYPSFAHEPMEAWHNANGM